MVCETKWNPDIRHFEPGMPGPFQGMSVQAIDGTILIVVGLEPINEDESYGIHVSCRHGSRQVSDDELKAIGDKLFNGKPYKEENAPRNLARHLWELPNRREP